jgi:hypothetical protein
MSFDVNSFIRRIEFLVLEDDWPRDVTVQTWTVSPPRIVRKRNGEIVEIHNHIEEMSAMMDPQVPCGLAVGSKEVREKERKKERERERKRKKERKSVCVCVWSFLFPLFFICPSNSLFLSFSLSLRCTKFQWQPPLTISPENPTSPRLSIVTADVSTRSVARRTTNI